VAVEAPIDHLVRRSMGKEVRGDVAVGAGWGKEVPGKEV